MVKNIEVIKGTAELRGSTIDGDIYVGSTNINAFLWYNYADEEVEITIKRVEKEKK